MKTIGDLLKSTAVEKKQYKRAVKHDGIILGSALTGKVRIKVRALPIRDSTIIRYGVSKDGVIEQGRSIRVAKIKLKAQLNK